MTKSELINDILSEWAYRVDDGQPNPKNAKHIAELSLVLTEMGLSEIKDELFENLTEADKQFSNPILNKEIPYKAKDGSTKKGIVGNLLRLPKDSEGRKAAEKMLPADEKGRDDAMKDLGSEKDGKSTTLQQPKDKEDEKDKGGDEKDKGAADAEKQKATQAMFQDPSYKSARLDTEKAALAKIAQDNKENDESPDGGTFGTDDKEKSKEEDPNFKPVQPDEVAKEMPEADTAAFNQDSDIENISPQERHTISTKIDDLAKMADEAKAKGEKAPNYNLCKVTVPGTNLYCDNNLGIPREQMPQFKGKPQPDSPADKMPKDKNGEVDTEEVFKQMLANKGIKTADTEVPSDSLKASQSELVGAKVAGMTKALEEDPLNKGITAPIYVSRDGYVIDGHHRWAAVTSKAIKDGKPANMKVHVIDMDAKDIIPMANKFAEDIGVAAKKADANAETTPSHKDDEQQNKVIASRIQDKIKGWAEEEKDFFKKKVYKGNSPERRSWGEAIKAKGIGAWHAIVKGAKHEVEEFKTAGHAVKSLVNGDKLDEHQKKALKAVGIKVATTALFGGLTGGLEHGLGKFALHVAKELIPHTVGETIAKGIGKASLFAGAEEEDMYMEKFLNVISEKMADMDITPEMLEQMVDSYNEKNDSKTNEDISYMKDLVTETVIELINELMDEAEGFKAISNNTDRIVSFQTKQAMNAAIDSGSHRPVKATKPAPSKKQKPNGLAVDKSYQSARGIKPTKPTPPKKEQPKPTPPKSEEPQTTNPYAQPGQKVTDPKEVNKLMASDTKKVLSALNKTKEQEQAEKEAAKKAGKKLGVGAGTAASRAGECAVVSGGKMLTDAIAKGIPFEEAIKKVEANLRKVANNPDTLLDNEWVNSAITTLTYINHNIGFNKISQFTWDTDEGRAVVGSEGHGTSSDCFMLLKDGTRLGLSLKKDLNVFVFSGGMAQMMENLESQGMRGLPTLEDYKNRRTEEMSKIGVFAKNKNTHDVFCKDFNNVRLHPESRFEEKGLTNRLNSIQKISKKPLKSLNCDEFINSVVANPKGDNIKILADICKTSNVPELKQIYKNTRGLDREMTGKVTSNFTDPKNKSVVNELVRKETHIDDILFPNNAHLDKLMVVYGEDPAIEMKKENLIGLLNIGPDYDAYNKEKNPAKKAKIRQALDEKINSQIKVTNKGGVMSVGIDIGKSIIPIFEARVRTRGIGNAPTFEMPQSRFGGLAFKNGTTNFREWKDPKDRIDVVSSMSKELMDDMDDLDVSDPLTKEEIIGRIKRLRAILPEGAKNKNLNKALLKLKDLGMVVN